MTENFHARDLESVLDRHVLPVTVVLPDYFRCNDVHGVTVWHAFDNVDLLDAAGDHITTIKGSDMVELSDDAVIKDEAPKGIIAYGCDGDLLCADHGAPLDDGTPDGAVWPIFGENDLSPVEYCSGHEHSFCTVCGTDLQTTRGAHDRDVEGPFARCWNCDTCSVYVDGEGFQYVNGFGELLDTHTATVQGVTAYCQTNIDGTTKVDAINADNVPLLMRELKAYAAWCDADPSAGLLLILAESDEDAGEVADEWTEEAADTDDAEDEDDLQAMLSDRRADTHVERIKLEDIDISPRH